MKNENNKLNLKQGSWVMVVQLKEGITVAIPTVKVLANVRIVDVDEDGSFTAHWDDNYNLNGDFRTELMRFDNDLVLDSGDMKKRNDIRKANGLMPIK